MRKMKDSGVEWIGMIPEGWEKLFLGQCYQERKKRNSDGQVTNVLSLSYGRIIRRNVENNMGLLPESFNTYNVVVPGNIVLRFTDLQNDTRSLRTGLVNEKGIITSAYLTLESKCELDPRFNHYLLHSYDTTKVFYGMGDGVRQNLKFTELAKLPLLVPSFPEQQRIAEYLDRKCAKIDDTIDKQRVVIEKLKAYKQSVITHAVTKGLNPNAPMKESGIEWIGMIPEGWDCLKFSRIATVKSNLVQPELYYDYLQVSPENIEKGSGKLLECKTVRESGIISGNHLFKKGQILYSKIRPKLNKVTIAPFDGLCSADMYPIDSALNSRFLLSYMLSETFLIQLKFSDNRVKMPKINQEELGVMMVVVPPAKEQRQIADYLDRKCADIDTAIAKKEALIERLGAFKKSLIYVCVTGKREVV